MLKGAHGRHALNVNLTAIVSLHSMAYSSMYLEPKEEAGRTGWLDNIWRWDEHWGLAVKLHFTLSTHRSPLKITVWRSLGRLVNSCLPYVKLPRLMPWQKEETSEQKKKKRQSDLFLISSQIQFRRPYSACHSFSGLITEALIIINRPAWIRTSIN